MLKDLVDGKSEWGNYAQWAQNRLSNINVRCHQRVVRAEASVPRSRRLQFSNLRQLQGLSDAGQLRLGFLGGDTVVTQDG